MSHCVEKPVKLAKQNVCVTKMLVSKTIVRSMIFTFLFLKCFALEKVKETVRGSDLEVSASDSVLDTQVLGTVLVANSQQ